MRTYVFATAAARDAPNGEEFLSAIRDVGLPVVLLSGEEEARLSAYGILSGAPEILTDERTALAGDIGGGSLELAELGAEIPDWVGRRVSVPLGALRLSAEYGDDREAAKAHIDQVIGEIEWLRSGDARTLHVVGGAWRAIARIAILQQDHPLDILDRYSLPRAAVTRLCALVSRQSASSLETIDGVQRRRAPTLPYAAMVLESVIMAGNISRIEVSASGVREGILFANEDRAIQSRDPLIELSRYFADRFGTHFRPPSDELMERLDELGLADDDRKRRWTLAAAHLCNISGSLQPDERPHHAARITLAMPFRGVGHEGRVFIAAALAARHGATDDELHAWLPMSLLDDADIEGAVVLGLALRFLVGLAPTGGPALSKGGFARTDTTLDYRLPQGSDANWGPSPAKRLERLASRLGLTVPPATD